MRSNSYPTPRLYPFISSISSGRGSRGLLDQAQMGNCLAGNNPAHTSLFFLQNRSNNIEQADCFSPSPHPRQPSATMSIEGEGFGPCPHLEREMRAVASAWPEGPSQPVDEESTRQRRMPMEDGSEIPFFSTGCVESV
jgi:hypothetical protein